MRSFKVNKKSLLLTTIIREYIKSKEPIGSEYLKLQLEYNISSATIRNYCKILEKEGYLSQLYISSGRIPTVISLKDYWRENLKFLKDDILHVDPVSLRNSSKNYEVYCVVDTNKNNRLESVNKLNERYIVLHFSRGEVLIPFNSSIYKFMDDLIGNELGLIISLAKSVCANELAKKILALKFIEDGLYLARFGSEFLVDMLQGDGKKVEDYLNTNTLILNRNGIYFENIVPPSHIAIICDVVYENQEARMLCIGNILNDYENFFKNITA